MMRCLVRLEVWLRSVRSSSATTVLLNVTLLEVLCADLVERRIRFGDRIFHRGLDRFRRLFPIGDRQDGICLRRGRRRKSSTVLSSAASRSTIGSKSESKRRS